MAWLPVLNLSGATGPTGYTGADGISATGATGPAGLRGTQIIAANRAPLRESAEFTPFALGDFAIDLTTGIMWRKSPYVIPSPITEPGTYFPQFYPPITESVAVLSVSFSFTTSGISTDSYDISVVSSSTYVPFGRALTDESTPVPPSGQVEYSKVLLDGQEVVANASGKYSVVLEDGNHTVIFDFKSTVLPSPQLVIASQSVVETTLPPTTLPPDENTTLPPDENTTAPTTAPPDYTFSFLENGPPGPTDSGNWGPDYTATTYNLAVGQTISNWTPLMVIPSSATADTYTFTLSDAVGNSTSNALSTLGLTMDSEGRISGQLPSTVVSNVSIYITVTGSVSNTAVTSEEIVIVLFEPSPE